MAAVLLAAGNPGKRSAMPHSRVMIHQPMGGAQGQASDMAIAVKEILEQQKQLYQILAEHTGKPLKQITKDADRDFWMCAEEAVKYGIVDEVLRKTKK
jgi:ATP-dependent Clp protease protease subunit